MNQKIFESLGSKLINWHGIKNIMAPAGVLAAALQPGKVNCDLHLPERKPVEIHLKLNRHKPLDWVAQVTKQAVLSRRGEGQNN